MKLIQINPDFPVGYSLLVFNYCNLGYMSDARTALKHAEERKLEIPDLSEERYDLAFLEHDPAATQRETTRAELTTQGEDLIFDRSLDGG